MPLKTHTHQVFGLFKGGATTQAAERAGEVIPVSTVYGVARGSDEGARYGFTAIPGGSIAGSITVWYSHLPFPRPEVDADWWPDPDVGTITLTSGTTLGKSLGNICTDWVRYRVNVTTQGTLCLWHRADRGI